MVPSFVTEAPQFQLFSGALTGAGRACGSPQPSRVFATFQIRRTCGFIPGGTRDDAKYMGCPSGERRGGKSRFLPEKGRTSGMLHWPPCQCETQSSAIRGNVVVGFSFVK